MRFTDARRQLSRFRGIRRSVLRQWLPRFYEKQYLIRILSFKWIFVHQSDCDTTLVHLPLALVRAHTVDTETVFRGSEVINFGQIFGSHKHIHTFILLLSVWDVRDSMCGWPMICANSFSTPGISSVQNFWRTFYRDICNNFGIWPIKEQIVRVNSTWYNVRR